MYLTRHSEMIRDVNLDSPIAVFGAGSIGSYAILALAKLGYKNITVFDDGFVEEENIAPQFYRSADIGKFKVDCLKKMIKSQSNIEIIAIPKRYDEKTQDSLSNYVSPIATIILAVDSMAARNHITNCNAFMYLVDARMAIEFLTVISATYSYEASRMYRNTLFSDENAVQENCTNKAISYTSLIAGGLVAKSVLDLHRGKVDSLITVNFDINNFDMVRL